MDVGRALEWCWTRFKSIFGSRHQQIDQPLSINSPAIHYLNSRHCDESIFISLQSESSRETPIIFLPHAKKSSSEAIVKCMQGHHNCYHRRPRRIHIADSCRITCYELEKRLLIVVPRFATADLNHSLSTDLPITLRIDYHEYDIPASLNSSLVYTPPQTCANLVTLFESLD